MSLIKVGQVIGGQGQLEVLSVGESEMRLKVLSTDSHLKRYLDVGQEYSAHKHDSQCGSHEVWEISADQMHRSSSQALIFAWDDTKAEIELDF